MAWGWGEINGDIKKVKSNKHKGNNQSNRPPFPSQVNLMYKILTYKPTCKKLSEKEKDWRQDAVITFKEGLSYFCYI